MSAPAGTQLARGRGVEWRALAGAVAGVGGGVLTLALGGLACVTLAVLLLTTTPWPARLGYRILVDADAPAVLPRGTLVISRSVPVLLLHAGDLIVFQLGASSGAAPVRRVRDVRPVAGGPAVARLLVLDREGEGGGPSELEWHGVLNRVIAVVPLAGFLATPPLGTVVPWVLLSAGVAAAVRRLWVRPAGA